VSSGDAARIQMNRTAVPRPEAGRWK